LEGANERVSIRTAATFHGIAARRYVSFFDKELIVSESVFIFPGLDGSLLFKFSRELQQVPDCQVKHAPPQDSISDIRVGDPGVDLGIWSVFRFGDPAAISDCRTGHNPWKRMIS